MSTSGYALFPTAIGLCGLAWSERGLTRVVFPEPTEAATRARLKPGQGEIGEAEPPPAVARAIADISALLESGRANLGGIDLSGSYWLTKRWGVEGSGRGYLGTSGAAPNPYDISGPFVQEYFFVGGPEWLGPHNKHGAIVAHALVGGVYGNFEQNLRGHDPSVVGFYNDQVAFASVIGGHFDLNRSARWVFRVTPDANITHYGIDYGNKAKQWDVNFAISVGVQYRFKPKRY